MGIFGPSRRQMAQFEREKHAGKVRKYSNPPKEPLPTGMQWMLLDGGFLPVVNEQWQRSGNLGVLEFAPEVPGDVGASHFLRKLVPGISVFIDGKALHDAFDDGWIHRFMQSERLLSDMEWKFPEGSLLFHYYFPLAGAGVSNRNAAECFNVIWPKFLETSTWDAFRKALHAGELPGAPEWWRSATLS